MNQVTRYSKLFSLVAVVLSIIGYSFLVFYGFKLQKDIEIKKQDIENLEKTRLEKIEEIHKLESKDTQSFVIDFIPIESEPKSTPTDSDNGTSQIIEEKETITTNFNNLDDAEKYESIGFKYLIKKDIDLSIKNFDMSEYSYNGYKSVFEISRFLKKNKQLLKDPNNDNWKVIYKKILSDYSWKMSDEHKMLLQNEIK